MDASLIASIMPTKKSWVLKKKYCVVVYGQRDYYQIQLALHEIGALDCVYTDIFFPNWLIKFCAYISPKLASILSHRNHPDIPSIYFKPDLMLPLLKGYLKYSSLSRPERYSTIDCRQSRRAAAYAVKHSDISMLCYSYYWKGVAEAKDAGKIKNPTYVFQVHPLSNQIKQIIQADRQKTRLAYSPEPEETNSSLEDRKYLSSLQYADGIICSSSFTARGLCDEGIPSEKIRVVPYGINFSPRPSIIDQNQERWNNQKPFKILWVGQLAYRKGVHHFFDAIRKFSKEEIQVDIVSRSNLPDELKSLLTKNIIFYPSIDNIELNKMYQTHHLLILPSLIEGFGLVLSEALNNGLPILCTHNTGGPDLITSGVEGFIVPPGDSGAIGETINYCLENPNLMFKMSEAAISTAKARSWQNFRQEIRQSLYEFENTPPRLFK
jgi:glycosyltransferase involved in cell wall biosynthesis